MNPVRANQPTHIKGDGWSTGKGLLEGTVVMADGNGPTIDIAMDKDLNQRGWSVSDLRVDHNEPGTAVRISGGSFGHMSDVMINGYANCQQAIELIGLMAFRGVRLKVSNFSEKGLTDELCRGGNHSLTDCHFSTSKGGSVCLHLTMNGWSVLGGEINCNTGVSILCERTPDHASARFVCLERVRTELSGPASRGYVFDSIHTKPWNGGVVNNPQMVLKAAGIIGCDFQYCDSVNLTNPLNGGYFRAGSYAWRFGPKSTNCVVVENNIKPVLGEHYLDESASGSGNCVIYRGQLVYSS